MRFARTIIEFFKDFSDGNDFPTANVVIEIFPERRKPFGEIVSEHNEGARIKYVFHKENVLSALAVQVRGCFLPSRLNS